MLDGLEAVELKFSDILEDNETRRIDSEYYKKEYLTFVNILKKLNYSRLENISNVKGGKRLPLGENFSDEGIPYIRAEDNKKGFVDYENSPKISITLHNQLKAYQTKYDDVLLTIVGNSIGDVGIVKFNLKKCNLTENCVKVMNLKDNLKSNYLFAFLNSKFGQLQISREKVGTAQPKLAIERIRKFIIPNLNDSFQLQIENLVKTSYQKLEESKSLYKEAEELLLQELDLLDFKPSEENIATKSFKESFGNSGRLDSEYYQPKYDEIIEKIKSYKGGFESLSNILVYIDTGEYSEAYFVKDTSLNFYIRSTNISGGLINEDENYFVNPSNFTKFVKNGDIITARVGTLGIFGTVDKTMEGNIYSDNVLCFRLPDNLNPFVYTLFFNSSYNRMLIERLSRGSVQQRLNQETLKDLIIPIIDQSIQTQIEDKIKKSFELKEESKQLLDLAKRAVEVAIETNEDEAIKIISETLV